MHRDGCVWQCVLFMLYMPGIHSTKANVLQERAGGEGHEHTKHNVRSWEQNLAVHQPSPLESYSCNRKGPFFWRPVMGHVSSQFILDLYNFINNFIRPMVITKAFKMQFLICHGHDHKTFSH